MTVNRNPFQVPIPKDKSGIFNQVDFKGICDDKNDVTIEQMGFADALNVYVDEGNVLTSRPPLKFFDNEKYILKQWMFGDIGLRLRRLESEGTFTFVIECYTHEVTGEVIDDVVCEVKITEPVSVGYDYEPTTKLIQIEDKIYIWLTDTGFWCLNTATMTFEDARKYLYLPVHKQVFNGIESDLEDKNFLTDTYRKRHQYNAVSSINFEKLICKKMQVSLIDTAATSAESHLYDIIVQKNQEKALIYPYSAMGNNYHVDIVPTPRATVVLRYAATTKTIEVSLDGKTFRPVLSPEGIIGNPQLTKDGLWIVAFTETGIAKCKIVASETTDFLEPERVLSWTISPYRGAFAYFDKGFMPKGYFETIDTYACIYRGIVFGDNGVEPTYPILEVSWLSGDTVISGYESLMSGGWTEPLFKGDDFKLAFRHHGPERTGDADYFIVTVLVKKIGMYENGGGLSLLVGSYDSLVVCPFRKLSTSFATSVGQPYVLDPVYFHDSDFRIPCERMDLGVTNIERKRNLDGTLKTLICDVKVVCAIDYDYEPADILGTLHIAINTYGVESVSGSLDFITRVETPSYFIFQPDTYNLITDKYLRIDGNVITLPDNGELYVNQLTNGNILHGKNIHRVTADGKALSFDPIISGDKVSYTAKSDYLGAESYVWNIDTFKYSGISNRYTITKLYDDGIIRDGIIRDGDRVKLTPDPNNITLPVGHTSNPFSYKLVLHPLLEELIVDVVSGHTIPLSIDSNGVWYNVDGMLWTSQLSSEKSFLLDEYINADTINIGTGGNLKWFANNIDLRPEIPRYNATLDEHYMSFTTEDGLNLLQVTSAKRDGTLYLPKINEQKFSKPITNLHVLSENEVGVFTQDEIWYIRRTSAGYTKPIKSKIPAGCRDGSDIITALDGKIIIFTTQRGVAALSPQDFIASTEQTLTYLSDNIQSLYYSFYNDRVHSIKFLPDEFEKSFDPMIKIVTYKYWIIFHKYMDRTVLAFDTRNSVWWKWKSSYPIKSMTANMRLHFLMEVDFNPVYDVALYYPTQENSYLGMDFLWADREVNSVTYEDDVIEDSLNGYSELIENHRVLHYADPTIEWFILSQRLHFGKINNYKNIKAINIIAKGEGTQTAKLTTKVYRDFYHPERSEVMEISINDLVTFVRRMNLMHVMNFQYMLSADVDNEQQSQIKIDNIGIKYEVKEGI